MKNESDLPYRHEKLDLIHRHSQNIYLMFQQRPKKEKNQF